MKTTSQLLSIMEQYFTKNQMKRLISNYRIKHQCGSAKAIFIICSEMGLA